MNSKQNQSSVSKQTVFSHIVKKRLSQESENVATTALSFVLELSVGARTGLLKLLLLEFFRACRKLRFRPQQMDDKYATRHVGFRLLGAATCFCRKQILGGPDRKPAGFLFGEAREEPPSYVAFGRCAPKPRIGGLARIDAEAKGGRYCPATDRETSVVSSPPSRPV